MFLSRPLFFLALFALLGELILTPEIPFSYRFLFLFSLLFLSLFLFRKKKNRLFFCSLLCLTLFMLNFYSVNHRYRRERESIDYILPLQAVLRGKVMYVEEQEKKWKLLLSACIVDTALEKKNSSLKNEEKYQKRNDLHFQKLILYLPKESTGESSMPLPLPGQICSVKGHFLELSPATNEGEFSLPSYYKGEGISGVFQAKTIELVRGESSPFAKELFTLKQSRLFKKSILGRTLRNHLIGKKPLSKCRYLPHSGHIRPASFSSGRLFLPVASENKAIFPTFLSYHFLLSFLLFSFYRFFPLRLSGAFHAFSPFCRHTAWQRKGSAVSAFLRFTVFTLAESSLPLFHRHAVLLFHPLCFLSFGRKTRKSSSKKERKSPFQNL